MDREMKATTEQSHSRCGAGNQAGFGFVTLCLSVLDSWFALCMQGVPALASASLRVPALKFLIASPEGRDFPATSRTKA